MLGRLASAVEFSTIPTIRSLRDAIWMSSPSLRSSVLDTATSSGFAGGRPSERTGMPGPRSGAPNRSALRVASPSVTVPPAYTNGAAARTPGEAAILPRSVGAKGVAPTNGPDAPSLTRNTSTPSASTVRCASARNPLAKPVSTSVIAKMMAVDSTAMTKRRFRHCMSRIAASSMNLTLPTGGRLRVGFEYVGPSALSDRPRTRPPWCRRTREDHRACGWTPGCWAHESTPPPLRRPSWRRR